MSDDDRALQRLEYEIASAKDMAMVMHEMGNLSGVRYFHIKAEVAQMKLTALRVMLEAQRKVNL